METIDITPTWEAILPAMLEVLKNPKAPIQSKKDIQEELLRLARFADSIKRQMTDEPKSNPNLNS